MRTVMMPPGVPRVGPRRTRPWVPVSTGFVCAAARCVGKGPSRVCPGGVPAPADTAFGVPTREHPVPRGSSLRSPAPGQSRQRGAAGPG